MSTPDIHLDLDRHTPTATSTSPYLLQHRYGQEAVCQSQIDWPEADLDPLADLDPEADLNPEADLDPEADLNPEAPRRHHQLCSFTDMFKRQDA